MAPWLDLTPGCRKCHINTAVSAMEKWLVFGAQCFNSSHAIDGLNEQTQSLALGLHQSWATFYSGAFQTPIWEYVCTYMQKRGYYSNMIPRIMLLPLIKGFFFNSPTSSTGILGVLGHFAWLPTPPNMIKIEEKTGTQFWDRLALQHRFGEFQH